jgi:hypothetical protein
MINAKVILTVTGIVAVSVLGATPSAGRDYPFCRNGEAGPGYCRYDTLEQCQAAVSGTAGYCQPNYWLPAGRDRSTPRSRRLAE